MLKNACEDDRFMFLHSHRMVNMTFQLYTADQKIPNNHLAVASPILNLRVSMSRTTINDYHRNKTGLILKTVAALTLAVLAGCGGGGSSTTASSTGAAATTMTGTVAVGNALTGANILVIDSNGNTSTTTSDSTGTYSVSLTGLSAPFFISATDPNGTNTPMYSVVASVPTGAGTSMIANVTTLTTAIAAQLTTDGNPLDLATPSTLSSLVTTATVNASVSKLNTALTSILSANGLSSTSFDPIGTAFTPNQTGADAVIDAVTVSAGSTGGLQLASIASPGTAITLTSSAAAGTALTTPTVQANYLATLLSQLGQCLSGTNSACTSAIDGSYLENGFSSFQTYHDGISANGSTITGVKTLKIYPAGQFPNTNVTLQSALVEILYTSAAGVPNYALTVVQHLANGNWDIIGNQQAYDITISSFVDRSQYLDSADAPYSRFEAGLGISVYTSSASPNPVAMKSASVTGPGLGKTLWLEPRNAAGNDLLSLTNNVLTTAPTGGTTTGANTSLYRWSWQGLTSSNTTYVPPSNAQGHFAASPIDISTVAPFAVYTVTLYDTNGNQIGQPVSVINSTAPLSSAAANNLVWQTLGSDVVNNFLNPNGSLAGTQTAVTLDWSNLVNQQNLAPLLSKVAILTGPGTNVTPNTEIDGWWPGPATFATSGQYAQSVTAGVQQNGVQSCNTACPFNALVAGATRTVEFNSGSGGTTYYTLWHYVD